MTDSFSQAVIDHGNRQAEVMLDELQQTLTDQLVSEVREAQQALKHMFSTQGGNDSRFTRNYNLQVRRWAIDSAHSRGCDGYACDGS